MRYLSNIDLTKNEIRNAKVHNVAVLPTPTTNGDYGLLQYRTSDNTLQFWNGISWQIVTTGGSIPDATTTTKGIVQLTNDLGGTATAPTVVGLHLAADTAINHKLTNVTDPTGAQDAATKSYVDTATIHSWKVPVRVVSGLNQSITSAPATIDGVTLATGDRVLLTSQTTASENGIYVFNGTGSAMTRATDATSATNLYPGARVPVLAGTYASATFMYLSGAFTAQLWGSALYATPSSAGDAGGVKFGTGVGGSGGQIDMNGSYISIASDSTRAIRIQPGGSNDITFTSVGISGPFRGTPAAQLDLATGTTPAKGIAFGNNEFQLYRSAANTLALNATAGLALSSAKITGVADPTVSTDVATKNYVDNVAQGLDAKASVLAATTAALPANTATATTLTANANAAFPAQDGITIAAGNRVLVKNEATTANNGIYTLTTVGSGVAPWVLTRATDMDTWAEVPNAYAWVEQGTVNGDTGWVTNADTGGTLGTTGVPWVKFASAAQQVVGYYSNTFTTGAGTTISVPQSTHGLRSARGLICQIQDDSSGETVYPDVSTDASGNITVTFAVTQGASAWRVTVIG